MKVPTTYPAGTLVQIISAAEFDALPKNDAGCALFLDPLPNGNVDYILDMKPYCGKEFIVVKIVHDKDLPDEPIYFLNYSPNVYDLHPRRPRQSLCRCCSRSAARPAARHRHPQGLCRP